MKKLYVFLALNLLSGSISILEAKTKGPVAAKAVAKEQDTYEQLLSKYQEYVTTFGNLDKEREKLQSGCATQDQLAEVTAKIAAVRAQADILYDMLNEMPQFGAYKGQHIPQSPRVCTVTKNMQQEIEKLKNENKKIKTELQKQSKTKKR